jgi:hypothetical protein
LPNTSFADKLLAWDSIEENSRSTRTQNLLDPTKPNPIETHVLHYLQNDIMLNSVKSFGKVKLENNDWPF